MGKNKEGLGQMMEPYKFSFEKFQDQTELLEKKGRWLHIGKPLKSKQIDGDKMQNSR